MVDSDEPIMGYDKVVAYADKQIVKDFRNPLFLFIFCSLCFCFILAFCVRNYYPYVYLSVLAGFNALVISYCSRVGLVFLPAIFVFLTTFERFRNMNV